MQKVLRGRDEVPAAELLAALDVSAATLSRAVRRMPGVVKFGAARASRYAAVRAVRNVGGRWPLARIRADGRKTELGELVALSERRFLLLPAPRAPDWLIRGATIGVFDHLPWYLQDVRPQGFLGRAFARGVSAESELPPDPRDWSADDQVVGLVRHGADLPGDLVLGSPRGAGTDVEAPSATSEKSYPSLARSIMIGEAPGSSAGGEQPKFTTAIDGRSGGRRHVLVKFANGDSDAGRRWRDLLAAEELALETLREAGVEAANARIVDVEGWRFLEVERFDRIGSKGRRSSVTLSQVDAQFAGVGAGWHRAVDRLAAEGVVSASSARVAARAEAFGAAIANTDRHFGNLAFQFEGNLPANIAPIYDMLPMAFAPGSLGPRPYVRHSIEFARDLDQDAVEWARAAARTFWSRLSRDVRVSREFRAVASTMAAE